ncbi:STAS domain-containing protein [Lignipirellula cremea]|uniref:STAS domain-containing protein n=1 Tax=Lignipirellula cremea TaxID=2528010 RepID=A0A518DMF9_9BACT|nr:STAS domain-containing protein [Lignipirellula cremea]QDU93025.1 hypothetical protein Pla8534_08000 [Lignipirellula cremea]
MDFSVRDPDAAIVHIGIIGALTQKQLSQQDKILKDLVNGEVYERSVLFSLANTDFIDSSGINWLLVCHKRFIENNGRMVLHSIPPLVNNVLKILHMESVFELAPDEASAIQLLSRPRPQPPRPRPIVPAVADDDADDGGEEE